MGFVVKRPRLNPQLEAVTELEELLAGQDRDERGVRDCRITGVTLTGRDLYGVCFQGVRLERCRFLECDLEKSEWIDVCFHNCDFSNSNLSESYFYRCEGTSCKALGSQFQDGRWKELSFSGSNFQYSAFDSAVWEHVTLDGCNLNDAILSGNRWKGVVFQESEFISSSFFKTSLNGIDFRSSHLEGIRVSSDLQELRGMIVTPDQAAELARLLGIVVK